MLDFRNLISGGEAFLKLELWFKEGLFWLVFSGKREVVEWLPKGETVATFRITAFRI